MYLMLNFRSRSGDSSNTSKYVLGRVGQKPYTYFKFDLAHQKHFYLTSVN